MWNEIDQNAVKQVDVIGPEICRPEQEQFGDPAGCLRTTLGIAMFDEFIKPRGSATRQMSSNALKPKQTPRNPRKPRAIDEFSGNLGGLGEATVRFELSQNGCKIICAGFAGLAG